MHSVLATRMLYCTRVVHRPTPSSSCSWLQPRALTVRSFSKHKICGARNIIVVQTAKQYPLPVVTSSALGRRWKSGKEEKRASLGKNLLVGSAAAMAFGFGKLKYVLIALKLTKLAPMLSMVASSVAYSYVFGPIYGCGMVGLILCHESGHALAMRYYGVPFSGMVFIPFVGAAVAAQAPPKTAAEEVVIALAGPYFGSAAAAAVALAGNAADSQLLIALADWGFMVNAFNLLPIYPLDGGRVADCLAPWLPALGLAAGCGLAATGVVSNPIFYFLLLGGGFHIGSRLLGTADTPAWKRLAGSQMYFTFSAYAAIVAALIAAIRMNNTKRKTPRQIQIELADEKLDAIPGTASPVNVEPLYGDYFAAFQASDTSDSDDDVRGKSDPPLPTGK